MQALVATLNQGHKTVAQLLPALESQSQALRDHIDRKFEDQARIKSEKAAQQRFKDSLFFPEILARQEQIQEAHEGTCRWIFRSSQDETDSRDENDSEDEKDNEAESDSEDENSSRGEIMIIKVQDDTSNEDGTDRKLETDDEESDHSTFEEHPWPDFTDWLKSDNSAYWINGKPGSGKSTLMEYIRSKQHQTEDSLTHWARKNELMMVYFYFWNPGTELQKNSQGLLRSLLYQIIHQRPDLTSLMMDNPAGSNTASDDLQGSAPLHAWTERRLLNILQRFLKSKPLSLSICFFIDGLDEFAGSQDVLLEIIRLLIQTPQIKVCVSSRPEQIFRLEFRGFPQLKLQDFNQHDLEKTVNDKLKPVLSKKFPSQQKAVDKLSGAVSGRAQGVFLWLDMVVRDVLNGVRNEDSLEELERRLDIMPDTIDDLFRHMMEKMDRSYQEEARQYFYLLILIQDSFQFLPCTLLHLIYTKDEYWHHVLYNDKSYLTTESFLNFCKTLEDRVITRCAGLVEVGRRQRHATRMYAEITSSPGEFYDVELRRGAEDLSSYWREVSFIHRSASDYVRYHYKEISHSTTWRFAAILSYARGQIGLLTILPILLAPERFLTTWEDEIAVGVTVLVTSTIIALHDEAAYSGLDQRDQAWVGETTQMVGHLYNALCQFDKVVSGPEHKHFIWKTFLANPVPFNDLIGFASSAGHLPSVTEYLSSSSYSPEKLDYILTCTIAGMSDWYWASSSPHIDWRYLIILENLLHLGANPNLKVCTNDVRDHVTSLRVEQSALAYIFLERYYADNHPDWFHIFSLFLLKGAYINASIFSFLRVRFKALDAFIIEESVLSYLKRISTSDRCFGIFKDQIAQLQLLHALELRHFRMLRLHNPPFEPQWYRFSESQSERLSVAWCSPSLTAEDGYQGLIPVVEKIKAELTEADRVDHRTFVLRPISKLQEN